MPDRMSGVDSVIGTRLIFEDDACRVWLLDLQGGGGTTWHRHQFDYVYVVTDSGPVATESEGGSLEEQDDLVGVSSLRRAGDVHRLINRSGERYRNIIIELKLSKAGDQGVG